MTEKQIEILIDFQKAIIGIKDNKALIQEDYYNALENLNSKIQSALRDEYKPVGLMFVQAREIDLTKTLYSSTKTQYIYNDSELDRCADVMLATIDGIIAKIPNYEHICQVRADIKRAKSAPAKKRKEIVVELVSKYSGIIKFDKTVLDFAKPDEPFSLKEDQSYPILQGVIGRLELYLGSLSMDKPKSVKSTAKTTNINVTQTQNNSQVQNVATDINVSIQNCLKDLDDCETLSEQELEDIKAQLGEIKQLLADKRGKKKTIKEKISSILKWVADKGTDVMIAVLPTLITALNLIK